MSDNQNTQFAINRLYIKDASFEAPLGAKLFAKQWKPELKVDISTNSGGLSDDQYEVVLRVTVTGKIDDEAAFLIEVQQAGIFLVKGFVGDQLANILGVACPSVLFPYIREVIDSLAIKGGLPAIGLQPVNFEALYAQSRKDQQGAAEH